MHSANEIANRMDAGWWAPAVMIIILTITEWTGAFFLITNLAKIGASWELAPTNPYNAVLK
jgi:hypothetical protein